MAVDATVGSLVRPMVVVVVAVLVVAGEYTEEEVEGRRAELVKEGVTGRALNSRKLVRREVDSGDRSPIYQYEMATRKTMNDVVVVVQNRMW